MPVAVRYIVNDVDEAIAFYTKALGFKLDIHPAPGFARLSCGELHLLLNKPGAGGAGQLNPQAGGWNRFQIPVENLASRVEALKADGHRFRSEIIAGNGGLQILIEDPSGNPVELFEAQQGGGRPAR